MSSFIFLLLQNVTYTETIGLVYPIIIAIVPYFDQRALGPLGDNPVNTKHLYNICTMLYKCFVFAGKCTKCNVIFIVRKMLILLYGLYVLHKITYSSNVLCFIHLITITPVWSVCNSCYI